MDIGESSLSLSWDDASAHHLRLAQDEHLPTCAHHMGFFLFFFSVTFLKKHDINVDKYLKHIQPNKYLQHKLLYNYYLDKK